MTSQDDLLDRFLEYLIEKNISLYPAQEEAILALYAGHNVILNTPTGSGKSLVATSLHFSSLAQDRRSFYTCPIKALVNEKFLSLCREFGPEQVGMITGDASVNPGAPIVCCTAEILANMAMKEGKHAKLNDVIMDEFHYYSDRDRGVNWQIPLLTLPNTRFLLMSATLGDTQFFENALSQLNQLPTTLVTGTIRPVPLTYEYSETPLHETVEKLISRGRVPIYVVNFTQRECAEEAQNFLSIDFCTREEKQEIQAAITGFRFNSPYGKEIQKLIKHGIGIHHAGLLPKYRVLVEKLAQQGHLKLIFGTDTLGVGVNVPIRTVLFTKLCKFDGEKNVILPVRDFKQIAGRAGRKGFDNEGFVVSQAPEHIIENIRMEQKAGGDPKKIKKLVRKKPPEKGFVMWSRETFDKLISGHSEPLVSRFKVSYGMILNVLSRTQDDGCDEMRKIIRRSHESDHSKKYHRKIAFKLFRSLVDRKIIELNPLRVNIDLQEDFSLNHGLSLYLLDALTVLDPNTLNYSLDALTLVESILENPEVILRKQLDRIKTEKLAEMKLEGIEFDQRIEKLEALEYPKPNQEFIYQTFNHFIQAHPWISEENIYPKSIVREMYETFSSFSEYIRDYGLQRSEGVLLRYLSDSYKLLIQTIPDQSKTEELEEIIIYLGSILRQIDSSLVDEWEKLRNPNWISNDSNSENDTKLQQEELFKSDKKFKILVRNEVFQLVKALSREDYEEVIQLIEPYSMNKQNEAWTPLILQKTLDEYFLSGHSRICTDSKARSSQNTHFKTSTENQNLIIQQILIDPDGLNDWMIEVTINMQEAKNLKRIPIQLTYFGTI